MALNPATTLSMSWADEAFAALTDDLGGSPSRAWEQQEQQQSFPPSAFAIASLPSEQSIKRYGQVTPPDNIPSPIAALLQVDSAWPQSPALQNMANFALQQQGGKNAGGHGNHTRESQMATPVITPSQASTSANTPKQQQQNSRASKRRRTIPNTTSTTKPAQPTEANRSQAHTSSTTQPAIRSQHPPHEQEHPESAPTSPKRKRGRPKLNPDPAPAVNYEGDGFPFPVASARQSHLEKNRVAAHKCRQRRKEYITDLETRAREHENRNKELKETVVGLREQVLQLKTIMLQHAGCSCWAIDEYLAQSAGDLLGTTNPFLKSRQQPIANNVRSQNLPFSPQAGTTGCYTSSESPPRQDDQGQYMEDLAGLDLLEPLSGD